MTIPSSLIGSAVLFFAVASVPLGQPAIAQSSPTFDFAAATTFAENAICADNDLAALDRALAEAYGAARKVGGDAVKTRQRAWIVERDACATPLCLAEAMEQRIGGLRRAAGLHAMDFSDRVAMVARKSPGRAEETTRAKSVQPTQGSEPAGLSQEPAAPADIAEAQALLAERDCYSGPINGQSSLRLRSAVRCFQRAEGIDPEDGRLTTDLLARLKSSRKVAATTVPASTATPAVPAAEPWEAERERAMQSPAGLPPQLANDDARSAWERFGIEMRDAEGIPYVASLKPGGPAHSAGIAVGEFIRGSVEFAWSSDASMIHRHFSAVIRREDKDRLTLSVRRTPASVDRRVIVFPGAPSDAVAAGMETVPPLPPAMQHLNDDAAMLALWRHDARAIDTPDLADAAMRILFALSYHVAGCHGPDAVGIPIRVTMTTETRNGFGVLKGTDVDTFDKVLKVRPVYSGLARRLVRFYSDNVMNRRFVAVRDLISQDTCDGPRLRRLEEGLALAARTTLPPPPALSTMLGEMDDDWRGFVAECTAASYPEPLNNEAGAAHICTVYEQVAREMGDRAIYDELRLLGIGAGANWPEETRQRFGAAFDTLYEDRQSEAWERFEIYRQDNGL